MKKVSCTLLTLLLLCALALPGFAAETVRTSQRLTVDGAAVECEIYNIDGSNYFKLRDLAFLLRESESRFAVGYDAATRTVTLTTGAVYTPAGGETAIGADLSATAQPGTQALLIDGAPNHALRAYNIGGSNFFKLRDLGAAVGFSVDYDAATKTMLVKSGAAPQPDGTDPVTYRRATLCGVTADILTVEVQDPRVRVRSAMVNGSVAARASFAEIVAHAAGARAVITGNFMNGDSEGNYPVGHVMSDGALRYIGSGFSALGITADGEVRVGRPSIRVRMRPTERDYGMWTAIGLNLKEGEQAAQFSVLYTPAFADSFAVTCAGSVTVVRAGRVQRYAAVAAGARVEIPADGYVLWLSDTYMREFVWNFQAPQSGEAVELEYFLYQADEEGFTLDGVTQIIAGAPRLVQGGAACYVLEPQFSGDRFTETYAAARTAVGVTAEGKLILISTDAATIPQLRELMLALGCTEAINLDGGASAGLYYSGKTYRTPSRLLATTVQIFVDG